MHREKLTVSCDPSTDILCDVESFRSPCDPSTDIVCGVENLLNCVWCGKLTKLCEPSTDIVCGVENLLTKYVS